eukprot:4434437-Pyramimonas_sp.AAC.1
MSDDRLGVACWGGRRGGCDRDLLRALPPPRRGARIASRAGGPPGRGRPAAPGFPLVLVGDLASRGVPAAVEDGGLRRGLLVDGP